MPSHARQLRRRAIGHYVTDAWETAEQIAERAQRDCHYYRDVAQVRDALNTNYAIDVQAGRPRHYRRRQEAPTPPAPSGSTGDTTL